MPLLTQLSEILTATPLTEAYLLGETTLQARLWRERLARAGVPWIGLRVASVRGLAREILESAAHGHETRESECLSAMEQACLEELADSELYAPVRHHHGLHAAFSSALRDLAHAGLTPDTLSPKDFHAPAQRKALERVAIRTQDILNRHALSHPAQTLAAARDRFSSAPAAMPPRILIPQSVYERLTTLERSVVEAAGGGAVVILEKTTPERLTAQGIAASTIRFRGAASPAQEFRAAVRDILETGTHWDEVELVYTDSSRLPELYELCIETELPCTFAEGIPVQYSKTARTVQRFLEWLRDGDPYPLIRLMYEGIPDFTAFSHEGTHANRLPTAVLLREARPGSDVRALLARVDRYIQRREAGQTGHDALSSLYASRALLAAITECIPKDSDNGRVSRHALIAGCIRLVRELCRPAFPGEAQAAEAISIMLGGNADGPDLSETLSDGARRLLSALRVLRMPAVIKAVGGVAEQSRSPLPGHVFVCDLRHAGISGRRRVFLFGMDDEAMPGRCPDNPVLTDDDRVRIAQRTGISLPLAREHGTRVRARLYAFLSRCAADITVSCARNDATQLRAFGPSRALLEVFRAATSNSGAGYSELRAVLDADATAPSGATAASMQDWWLQRMSADPRGAVLAAMRAWNPMLDAGLQAEAERDSERFTAFDGMIGGISASFPATSVSQLEQLGTCPYRYFLGHILGLQPPRSMRRAAGVWLDPAERGSLLHEVLRRFMENLRANALPRTAWAPLLDETAATVLAETAEENPPPSEAARVRAQRDLAEQCAIFLRGETETHNAIPLAFEVPFPTERQLPLPLTPMSAPLHFTTQSGDVLLRGVIDRIDYTADGALLVTDYKTGKNCADPATTAMHLQPAVYTETVRRMAPSGTEVRFAYRCISRQGQGRTVAIPTDTDATMDDIGRLHGLRTAGCLPHTQHATVCGYCDFRHVCGDATVIAARSRKKLANEANVALDVFRRLNDAH
ncbi:MAG: PD-(D/E)XK nuclease family protein [Bacteroidia bacterium]|nr:PD-(D/E)XK nuclease family protein [Bacteroidia bacterium]